MNKNKIAVVGVLYPNVEPYVNSYISSLENQTYKEFDLILMNDGWKDAELFFENSSLSYEIYNAIGSPVKIRIDLIEKLLKLDYEKIIFTDCDDCFSNNRVEISVENLKNYDIVVNDLDIVSEDNQDIDKLYLSNRIKDKKILKVENILHSNIMGLSNTAANSSVLKKCLPFLGSNLIALDWFLWTHALNFGYKAIFTSTTSTKYRIYSGNVAGMPQKINKKEVLYGISIKLEHYRELVNLDVKFEKLFNDFSNIKKNSEDCDWLNNYILQLKNRQSLKPFWWENIKIFGKVV
jgi:hypothetical protein